MVQERILTIGLSTKEAERRIEKYGYNEIIQKEKISKIKIFLSQFNDFMVWVLLGATIISGIMGDAADAVTIIIIVIVNAILGFIQEFRTEKSLKALKDMASPTCKVYRNGSIKVINSSMITIGDVVILEAGDRIPADGNFLEVSAIMTDESLLTGESVGVSKSINSKNNKGFMGTTVIKGHGLLEINRIGMDTEMGKIADLLDQIVEEKSPLKIRLEALGKVLVVICLFICLIVTVLGVLRGNKIGDMFLLGVSLAVAAIPEGLAAIVTVSLALGVSRMLKKNALIRRLPSVETLGSTSVICSDKTGTLTQNKMTVSEVYIDGRIFDANSEKVKKCILLKKTLVYCNDCNYDYSQKSLDKAINGDPTEAALIKLFFNNVDEILKFKNNVNRKYEIPFDSTRKMMSVIVSQNGIDTCYVKGAPEKVLARCSYILENNKIKPLSFQRKREIISIIEAMSSRALRCLAAAYKTGSLSHDSSLENNLIYIGTTGSIDPPREEARDAVLKCKLAGIKPVMITGDHKNTAVAIAKMINICGSDNQVITGEEIEKIDDETLKKRIKDIRVFARVSPDHKLRIVRAFRSDGNIVAMTGDGVNDAPAIKESDIGISMGISGTDVTKEASSMILMDDNFATIVAAVEEGRVIYDNIRKFIRYLLSCNLGEVLTMFLATIFFLPSPLTPIQILLVNLATDGLPALALGVDPPDIDIMRRPPRDKKENIFANGLTEKIFIRGSLIGICTLLSFMTARYYKMDLNTCRTISLATLIMSQLFHVFECRSEKHSIFEIKLFTNIYLVGAVSVSVIMLLCVLYLPYFREVFHTVPLMINQWLIVIFYSAIIAFINSVYLTIKSN